MEEDAGDGVGAADDDSMGGADAGAAGARGVFAGFSPDVNTAVVAPDTAAALALAVAACFS